MAKKAVIDEITAMMTSFTDKKVRKELSQSEIHQVELTTQETVAGFLNGTPKALETIFGKDTFYYRAFNVYNEKAVWQNLVRKTFVKLSAGTLEGVSLKRGVKINKIADLNLEKRQVRLMAGSTRDRWHLQIEANSSSFTIYELCAALRKELWKDWCDYVRNKGLFNEQEPMNTRAAHLAVGNNTNYSHEAESTIGKDRFILLIKQLSSQDGPNVDFKFKQTNIDLADWLQDKVKISVELTPTNEDGYLVGEKRVIKGRLEQQTKKLDTDWNQLKPKILEGLKEYLDYSRPKFVDRQHANDFEASNSIKKDVQKDKVRKEVNEIKKNFKKVKAKSVKVSTTSIKPSKRERRTIEKTFNKSWITKQNKTVVIPASVRKISIRKEKGADSPITLNALKGKINRRLPAEVRRNMGRPALINRTGQFSNSVKVLNLRDTGKTITGHYTYTLTGGGQSKNKRGVYSTFENKGIKQWPRGYNPKPLISKSIRNLAIEHIDKKFTLRRV
jgi:hypothetical protein